jgi:Asp-tRNA(Asn)/Glu-tRNA(Gln) amidotransferase A subunit family amidase
MCYLSIAAAARLVAARELSPVALTEAVFRRIAETDDRVHSYVRLMRSSAIEEARRSEERLAAGEGRGPLEGVPIAVKDLFDTAGVVTSAGLAAYRERVPGHDSTCVRRLREAGAVIIGKTKRMKWHWAARPTTHTTAQHTTPGTWTACLGGLPAVPHLGWRPASV